MSLFHTFFYWGFSAQNIRTIFKDTLTTNTIFKYIETFIIYQSNTVIKKKPFCILPTKGPEQHFLIIKQSTKQPLYLGELKTEMTKDVTAITIKKYSENDIQRIMKSRIMQKLKSNNRL